MMRASSKKINITPPIGLRMSGYEERKHGSIGIKDELYANILVLDNSKTKLAFVTMDVIGVDKVFMQYVRDLVSLKTDIQKNAIFVNASHTHSGPEAARFGDMGLVSRRIDPSPIDSAYYVLLPDMVANGIIWANNDLQPVKLGIVQGDLKGLGSNRIDADLYIDDTVTVLRVDRTDNQPMALIAFYSCHPTILNFDNYYYSGDFISYYQREVEKVFEGANALYAQGTAGNISTRHTRKGQGFEEAKRMGLLLAGEVIRLAALVDPIDDVELEAFTEKLVLPTKKFESDEACERKIREAEDKIRKLKDDNAPSNIQRTAYVEWQGATRYFRFKKMVDFDFIETEMQLIRIGDWKIVTTPGEFFAEIGQAIRNLDTSGKTIVTGYTNGYIGYVPDHHTYMNPVGYELNAALVSEDAEFITLEVAKKLLDK